MAGDFLDYMGNRFYGYLDVKDFCWVFGIFTKHLVKVISIEAYVL